MDELEIMRARHSVRAFEKRPIEAIAAERLKSEIEACNAAGDLKIRLVMGDADAFDSFLAHYGKFLNVANYIALIGERSSDLEQRCGYYGERLVLTAQALGLNTCWVAVSFAKGRTRKKLNLQRGEKLTCVIALGYGKEPGKAHKSKAAEKVSRAENPPEWFCRGVEAALLAPTAINQQRFRIELVGEKGVRLRQTGGVCRGLDFGIVKYHFEKGAGAENFEWVL